MGEEGRGADEDEIFGDKCLADLAKILGIKSGDPRLSAFGDALRTFGIERRNAIRTMPIAYPIAPFGASLTRRIEWLDTQVIKPTERLLKALEPDNRPYFSDWPEEFPIRNLADLDAAAAQLEPLLAHATRLHSNLQAQLDDGISHLSEMRYDIVLNILDILREHFPEVKLSRGQHDQELGFTIGAIPDFVRAAYEEITGSREKLDAPIQSTIQLIRKSRRKPR